MMSYHSVVTPHRPSTTTVSGDSARRPPCGPSFWCDGLPTPGARFPGGSRRVPTVVIGGGLTGLSAALHVLESQPDRQVVLLEAEGIGHGASSRSTGMLTPGIGQDITALVRRVGKDQARAMYLQSLQAVAYVGHLTAREEIDCQLRMTGQLVVARGRSGRKRLSQQATVLEALELPYERLDDVALSRTVRLAACSAPTRYREYPAALRLPVAGLLHPGRLLGGLASAIRKRGGDIYEATRVVDISKTQPATVYLADGGTLIADHVVLATGGYTRHIGGMQGRILPVHLRLLLTEPLEPAAYETLGWARREGIIDSRRLFNYFRLTEDNRILFGGGFPRYLWGGATGEESELGPDGNRLATELAWTFPAEVSLRIDRSWQGVISYVLDTIPVIGRLRDYPAVVFAGGWCGHGIALSVSSGAWVAHLLQHRCPPEPLSWFRNRVPRLPLELGRWLSIPMASWAMSVLDHL